MAQNVYPDGIEQLIQNPKLMKIYLEPRIDFNKPKNYVKTKLVN